MLHVSLCIVMLVVVRYFKYDRIKPKTDEISESFNKKKIMAYTMTFLVKRKLIIYKL